VFTHKLTSLHNAFLLQHISERGNRDLLHESTLAKSLWLRGRFNVQRFCDTEMKSRKEAALLLPGYPRRLSFNSVANFRTEVE
jgi:hypothetical protein